MTKRLKSQEGVTLVELLAVLVILSFVGLMVFGVYFSGTKEYDIQREQTVHQQNIQFVIKYLTKEIRVENNFIVYENDVLKINTSTGKGTDTYRLEDNALLKNDEVFADNIKDFKVKSFDEGNSLKIEVLGNNEFGRDKIKAETTISIR
ncbi:PilW family protein [Sporosarcina ureae]|uniref:PilW family protein n=1 Tax=Sporosarcina ureae TaxID=1571 RepID=UPI000A17EA6B|nr:prepilin-type N-terminal cleavage/methylation domain-containing protein [Sporosarcina ureae]ARK20453.1 hypothetical protein SporoP32a_02150 [Sporosarcina ureae]